MAVGQSLKHAHTHTHSHSHSYLEGIIRSSTSLLWSFNNISGSFLTLGLTFEGFLKVAMWYFAGEHALTTTRPPNQLQWRKFSPSFPTDSKEVGGKVIENGHLMARSHKLLTLHLLLPLSSSSLMTSSIKHIIVLVLWDLKGSWTLMYKTYLIKYNFLFLIYRDLNIYI